MNQQLFVHFRERVVGLIELTPAHEIHFAYSDAWLKSTEAFPISISLPLDGSFSTASSHHFFVNLLPEGSVREQICKSLKISPGNDFALLKAIGGDCAGALTISDSEDVDLSEPEPRYEAITAEQLAIWSLGKPSVFSDVTGQNDIRLSLAGAQDKLPVHMEGNQVFVPQGNTPSTFILKFASPHYSHLPENEAFISTLAKQIGLPAVDVRLLKTERGSIGVIARYDRQLADGGWRRLHQEDFCQAIGMSASRKYEKEGGPSLKQCADIIRQHAALPLVDLQKLLHWTLFNLFIANADAHGKNLSLLYSGSGSPTLAPFYDLVCTRNYKNLSREMAMKLGGAWDPDLVTTTHFEELAHDLGFRPKLVTDLAVEFAEKIRDALPTAIEIFSNRFGQSPVLERLPIIIRKQIRRVRSQLA